MPLTQEKLDQKIVNATIADISAFAANAADQQWGDIYHDKADLIKGLYAEYVPEMSEISGGLMALLSSSLLATATIKYGPDEMHPRIYSGRSEYYGARAERNVIATYHNALHPEEVMVDMFRYAAARNQRYPGTYSAEDFWFFPAIACGHDLIMGNQRGNDERQSGQVVSHLIRDIGLRFTPPKEVEVADEATFWNAKAHRQAFDRRRGYFPLQQAICVADLMSLCDKRFVYKGLILAPEEFCKHRFGQIFNKEARAAGFSLIGASVDTCMELVDERPVLQDKLVEYTADQVKLLRNYKPADPEIHGYFGGAERNLTLATNVHDDLRHKRLTAVGALQRGREIMYEAA